MTRRVELDLPMCESPILEQLLADSSLNDDQRALVRRFATDGLVVVDPGLDESTLDGVVAEVDAHYPGLRNRDLTRVQASVTGSTPVRLREGSVVHP
jgi:hypothetical protein